MAVFYDENGTKTVAASAEEIDRNGTWYDKSGNFVATVTDGSDGNTNKGVSAAMRAQTVDNPDQIHYSTSVLRTPASGTSASGRSAAGGGSDYNSLLARIRNALNQNAESLYNQTVAQVNHATDNALQQSYIQNRLAGRNLNQQLAAAGVTGGASESTVLGLQNQYGTNRAGLEQNRQNNLTTLGNTYQQTVAGNNANYYNSLASMQAQKEQQERAAQLQQQASNTMSLPQILSQISSTGLVSSADRAALIRAGYTDSDIAQLQKQGQSNRNLMFSSSGSGQSSGTAIPSSYLTTLRNQQEFYYSTGDWDNYNAVSLQLAQLLGSNYTPYQDTAMGDVSTVAAGLKSLNDVISMANKKDRDSAAVSYLLENPSVWRWMDSFLSGKSDEEQVDLLKSKFGDYAENAYNGFVGASRWMQ